MSKKKFCALVVFTTLVSSFICCAGEIVDGVYKITVAEDETRNMTSVEASELIAAYNAGTVTEFRKCGKGTLVSTSLANYNGPIVIAEGVYSANSGEASFGTSDGETEIMDEASVFINGYMELWFEHFIIAGKGVGNKGVVRAVGGHAYLSYLTMKSDCLIAADTGKYINFNLAGKKPFNMNGHTLTIDTTNQNTAFHGNNIINPGRIVNLRKRFSIYDDTALSHGASAVLELGGSDSTSDISIPACEAQNNWTLLYSNPNSIYGLAFSKNAAWHGPIQLDVGEGTAVINNTAEEAKKSKVYLYGNLSGEGNFDFKEREVYFYGTNTITGELRGSGFVTLANAKSVGDYSKFKITNPVWFCHSEGEARVPGFTVEEIDQLLASSWGESKFYVHVPKGCVFDYTSDISTRWTRNFYNRGEGVFQFSGTVNNAARFDGLDAGRGTIRFTGRNDNEFSYSYFLGGRFEFSGLDVFCSNESGFISTFSSHKAEQPTTVVITNSFVSIPNGKVRTFLNEYSTSALMRSVVEILADSVVTNNIIVGYVAPNSTSSVYMRDGLLNLPTGAASIIGRSGQGYWELSGGDMSISSQMHIGYLSGAIGMHYISGGLCTVEETGGFQIGGAGTALFYQSAGRFRSEGFVHICGTYDTETEGVIDTDAYGVMTLTGEDTECSIADYLLLARRSESSATVNINDGAVLETPRIIRAAWAQKSGFYLNDRGYVNFDGGILRVSASSEVFGGAEEAGNATYGKSDNHPTAVTIFRGGAVIDSSNFVAEVSVPLSAPAGLGVVSIPMPEAVDAANYIAPPVVKIVGDGVNATAAAIFDSNSRTWTGIVVTSPGWGYTAAKAVISWGGKDSVYEVDCVLGDVSGGGLEKRGSGELRLKCANTYTGATVVSEGSLVLADGGSIDSSCELSVAAGAEISVENGETLDFDTVAGCGTVKGDLVISGTLKIKASDLLNRRCLRVLGTVTLAPSASIVVEKDAELPEESRTLIRANGGVVGCPETVSGFDGKWFFSAQGGACRLVYPRSVGIIVR